MSTAAGEPHAVPLSPDRLVGRIVEHLVPRLAAARAAGVAVRLGVDGVADSDTGPLADGVAARAEAEGTPVARVCAGDFLHRRSVRLEWGPGDVESAYERWVDHAALRREVLDPLADPARMAWLPRLRDPRTDRSARAPVSTALPGTLCVVDGPYLLRPELAGAFDAVVHLDLSPGALARRVADPADPRLEAWRRYLAECDPAARADLVVRHDHPSRPALWRADRVR